MKARTQMLRCTIKLRSRQNTSINITRSERLFQLTLSLFLKKKRIKLFLSTTLNYTQCLLYELFMVK
jgi:hypothetical protein